MNKAYKYLFVSSLLGFALASMPTPSIAASKTNVQAKAVGKTDAGTEKAKAKRDWYPFYGTVAAVDKQANTISLKKKEGERVLKLDAKSTLEISGKPVSIGSVKIGDYAHGKLHKNSDGNEVITDAKFDKERPVKAKQSAGSEASKTSGSNSKSLPQ
jgi:hypothetical protein